MVLLLHAGAGQGATAGQMPPSDSDDSDEEEAPKKPVGMLAGVWLMSLENRSLGTCKELMRPCFNQHVRSMLKSPVKSLSS